MPFRRDSNTGLESHKVRCSVCGFPGIDSKFQNIGGGMFRTGNDNGSAVNAVTVTADALGVTSVADSGVKDSSKCPSCGTDNWISGSRGTL